MNKTAIKNFAVWARKRMMEDVRTRLLFLGITEKEIKEPLPSSTKDILYFDTGSQDPVAVSGAQVFDRKKLAERLEQEAKSSSYERAYQNLVENTAYVWFNRLVAIRFMEVNEYLSDGLRMLSSVEAGKSDPDIVSTPFDSDLEFTDKEHDEIVQLKLNNETDKLFRMLLFKRCHQLHASLPGLFEDKGDATEFLMRLSVVDADGVIAHLVKDIPEEDWKDQVQIIGWIYQFYNSELKDETFALLKKNVKVTKERIPAATQLFTPDWIVRYMVENSLGRFFVEQRKTQGMYADGRAEDEMTHEEIEKSRIATEELIAKEMGWKYFLPEAEQTQEVDAELRKIRAEYAELKPEELTFIDPCMGSGHILAYAFDVLMQIYLANGYEERDAAQSILQYNLYGLDIDERAYQLSYFALMMKAMAYDKRILSRGIRPHVYAIEESNDIDRSLLTQFGTSMEKSEREEALNQMTAVLDVMHDAKEYGSAIKVEAQDWELLYRFVEDVKTDGQMKLGMEHLEETQGKLRELVEIAEVLAGKYWVSCTNPPYMGYGSMSSELSGFVKRNYSDSKNDLFAVFIETCRRYVKKSGAYALITQHGWMFLTSFEKLRDKLSGNMLINMAHLGTRAFEEISGEVVQTTTFVFLKSKIGGYNSTFKRLVNEKSEAEKEEGFFKTQNSFKCPMERFKSLPNAVYAYWIGNAMMSVFEKEQIKDYGNSCIGMRTGDNARFLRLWFEISRLKMGIGLLSPQNTIIKGEKWIPYCKGGSYRKWYGNNEYVVNWENDGFEIKENTRKVYPQLGDNLGWKISNEEYYFHKGITWSGVGASVFGVRCYPEGMIFDSGANSFFVYDDRQYYYFAGLLNASYINEIINIINPTINTGCGVVAVLPVVYSERSVPSVNSFVESCICISKYDWDSSEISWDFARHPLLTYADDIEIDHPATEYDSNGHQRWTYESERASLLSKAYENWKAVAEERFTTLKSNEEELNRIFIDIYGLQEELTPEVADKDITVHRIYDTKADVPESMNGSAYIRLKSDEIKALLSYAVGCMFGRYSMNRNGLVYAGGDFDKVYWKHKGQAALDENGELPFGAGYAGVGMDEYCYPRFRDASAWEDATVLSFWPDADNVILICDEAYFGDDVVDRFCEFLSVAYGNKTLEDNLQFVSDALGGKGSTPREVIRNYFLNDFFKDHTKTYQKRPIYWLFDSGKQNGFKAFVYMHRWNEDTISRVRSLYLHKVQEKYENEIRAIDTMLASMTDNRMKAREEKRKEKLKKQIAEVKEYDEILDHLANEHINIDLDDGVKVNYEKVQTDRNGKKFKMLAPIK